MILSIDLETYSSNDIRYSVYKYTEAPDFEILLFAYSVDYGPVTVIDMAQGERLPDEVVRMLFDPNVMKTAFNANFEINCLKKLYPDLPENQWECTRILALYNGYPPHLAAVAKAMGLPQDRQKDTRGKALIKYFCQPCQPTAANGGRTRNYPKDAPDKWETFKEYNRQDVVVEMTIRKQLEDLRPPGKEHLLWLVDQSINRNGIKVDMELVNNAIRINNEYRTQLMERAKSLTGLDNPNSPIQLKEWLGDAMGEPVECLDKAAVAELLARKDLPDDVRELLRIRQLLSKSSIKKYDAMQNAACHDDRIRGMFQFYGAARSGRWAGRIVQLQNLRRNSMPDLDTARELVRTGDLDLLAICYDNIPDVLSQLIRTALIAPDGTRFIVADFSAIEARVIAWLAGEEWEMEAFKEGKDIYCATASAMFGVPVVKHGVNGELRQKGKVATLACGYGGGVGALKAMGADKMGLSDEEMARIVRQWREASPSIVKLWSTCEKAAKQAVLGHATRIKQHGLLFHTHDDKLFIELPSGRHLVYVSPHLGKNRFGNEAILYKGMKSASGGGGIWGTLETYGGKIVENCLAAGTQVLTDQGLVPIEHVSKDMRVWDGVSFVRHDGVVDKGPQDCITVDGLVMTPDHRVLTEKGWMPCVETQGLNWAEVRLPDRHPAGRKHERWEDNKRTGRRIGYPYDDAVLSTGPQLAGGITVNKAKHKERVYDVRNCGPRHRFAVYDPEKKKVRLVHNCVQAIARDCLAWAMQRLRYAGYKICAHIHDEVIIEAPDGFGSLDDAVRIMCQNEAWNEGLVMNADGFEARYYQKD